MAAVAAVAELRDPVDPVDHPVFGVHLVQVEPVPASGSVRADYVDPAEAAGVAP